MANLFNELSEPFVIIGMHRSGTSFLARVLHNNGIFMGVNQSGVNEARFFLKKNNAVLRSNGLSFDHPGPLTDLSSVEFKEGEFKRKFLGYPFHPRMYRHVVKEKGAWGWKDPRNTYTLPYWKKYFPGMKVIHIYRNGLDVALSFQKRNQKLRQSNSYYSDILNNGVEALKLWEQYYDQGESYRQEFGERFITIKYEDLIRMEPGEVEQLQTFIGRDVMKYLTDNAQSDKVNKNKLEALKETDPGLYKYATGSGLMKQLGYLEN